MTSPEARLAVLSHWRRGMYAYTVFGMVDLVLNRRLDSCNILLAQGTRGEHVGYLLPDGGRRFVQWLGFIERARARAREERRHHPCARRYRQGAPSSATIQEDGS